MPDLQDDLNPSIYQLARLRMRNEPLLLGRCSNKRHPMFTIKPANDMEEFYESLERIKESLTIKALWEEMEDAYAGEHHQYLDRITELKIAKDCAKRYQETNERIIYEAITGIRNQPSLPHPIAPVSSEANTSPSPSLPHADDAP